MTLSSKIAAKHQLQIMEMLQPTSQAENNATDVDDAAQTVSIGPQAIAIAHSIVNTALTQLCKYHLM